MRLERNEIEKHDILRVNRNELKAHLKPIKCNIFVNKSKTEFYKKYPYTGHPLAQAVEEDCNYILQEVYKKAAVEMAEFIIKRDLIECETVETEHGMEYRFRLYYLGRTEGGLIFMTIDEIIKARVEEFKDASEEEREDMIRNLEERLRWKQCFGAERVCNAVLWDKLTKIFNQIKSKELEEKWNERYKIFQPIKDWCEKYYYADFLVTIKADGCNYTTILYGGDLRDHDTYSFLDDWDEGQKKVELVGFISIDSIEVYVNGKNFPSNIVLHLYEDRANYETVKPKGD